MKLNLFYPVKPYVVNQRWGVFNPAYAQFGFSHHNGEDLNLINGQPIYAPFDCEVVRIGTKENGKWQPNGGGIFVGVLSKNTYDFEDGKQTKVLVDFLHCEKIMVQEGQTLSVGDVLALGDNTGFSTGSHTHAQFRREVYVNETLGVLQDVDKNDMNNSFDPDPYWNGEYAVDFKAEQDLIKQTSQVVNEIKVSPVSPEIKISWLGSIYQAILNLFKSRIK